MCMWLGGEVRIVCVCVCECLVLLFLALCVSFECAKRDSRLFLVFKSDNTVGSLQWTYSI